MKLRTVFFSITALLMLSGCGDQETRTAEKNADPTFMFWCFRKEIVSDDYHIPDMKTEAAASYIRNRLKQVPGYVNSNFDLAAQTCTVEYKSSSVRKMNFEEAIALAGFAVNNRPANPKAKVPEGIK
ncbi:heavy-metal-associated domain-containing protein [Pontiella sp.]|uniref:heavy-metal-associated domain-containing protein n=1 Tax=Pontiella sp. TaxID=2837462 RepID=UPI003569A63C